MSDGFDEVDWEALSRLSDSAAMEKAVNGEKTDEELAEYVLTKAAPMAAQAVVKLALNDPSSSIRLRASQYILDRAIGRVGDGPTKNAPWDDVFDKASVYVSEESQ